MTPLAVIELAIFGVAGILAARLAAKPPVRRELRDNPRMMVPLLAGAAGVAAAGIWAGATSITVRHALAAIAGAGLLAAWVRARPTYGVGRGWPRGSLGIGHSIDALDNRHYYQDQARRFGPIFKSSQFGRPVVCIMGFARARRLLVDHAAALGGAALPFNRLIPRGLLRWMHAEPHKAIAPLFRGAYSSLAFEKMAPEIRAIFGRELGRLAAESAADPNGASPRPFLQRAVLGAVTRIFYGLGPDDPRSGELASWMPALLQGQAGTPGWRRASKAAIAGITDLMRRLESEWTAQPPDDAPCALQAMIAAAPEAVHDATLAGNFILNTRIAYGDLSGLHAWIFKQLCDHPEALAPLRNAAHTSPKGRVDPADGATRVVMETLRMEQAEYLYRRLNRTIEFEGLVLPAGWFVRLCIWENHRDPAVFTDPDRFDPDRFAGRTFSKMEYSPFGSDIHGCMGSQMALFLGKVFVEELADGYEWRVVADGPLERGNRHRHHWAPSSRLRVVMTPRPR